MELGFAIAPAATGTVRKSLAAPMGDWPGLRARLSAAHAIRRELLGESAGAAPACGSFAPTAAQALAHSAEDLSRVNLTGLADGKAPRGMDLNLAGHDEPGERGK